MDAKTSVEQNEDRAGLAGRGQSSVTSSGPMDALSTWPKDVGLTDRAHAGMSANFGARAELKDYQANRGRLCKVIDSWNPESSVMQPVIERHQRLLAAIEKKATYLSTGDHTASEREEGFVKLNVVLNERLDVLDPARRQEKAAILSDAPERQRSTAVDSMAQLSAGEDSGPSL